jgi:aspartyl-tRNA(Asn)/glutamyl-tRNA(Gln) amidotransferase subunit B
MKYTPVIGLEVHVELKTASKMFCRCKAEYFGEKPNTNTCPVCLGLPGALPVPNQRAIEWCIAIAQALNCKINLFSKFDRKNYFYPDLAKGYQISQYDQPFGYEGEIILSNSKNIRIRRVHMEEDTGKLIHEGSSSLIDFNRSGVPLVEIVTEPDFDNATDVKEYLQKLQQIVRYLDVSDADMEKGNMRLEPNISLREVQNHELPKYKVEVKNINSFRFVEKAIEYEIKRQTQILEKGETPKQETMGWDENKQKTVSQRSKEEAHDYRYFPEPDIPPITFTQLQVDELKKHMPELPGAKQQRFMDSFNLNTYDAEILTRERTHADYFEEAVKIGQTHMLTPKDIANTIINKKIDINSVLPAKLIAQIVANKQVTTLDPDALKTIIKQVVKENEKAVQDYKNGKETVLMFLLGQVMRNAKQKLDPAQVKTAIIDQIKNA